jgi:hypothetical protein
MSDLHPLLDLDIGLDINLICPVVFAGSYACLRHQSMQELPGRSFF